VKALGISGSPREGGNTEHLVKRCLGRLVQAGIKSEFVSLRSKTIRPCTACGQCREKKNRECVISTDDFNPILAQMLEADILIVGSPVYFGSAVPELMALLDRAGYVGRGDSLFSRKLGGPIVVARRAGQNFTYAQLLFWYMINDMIVPGSTYWNIGFGLAREDVKEDQEALATVDRFADNLIYLAEKLG
jgi:multimeric flavodoxin WrbA